MWYRSAVKKCGDDCDDDCRKHYVKPEKRVLSEILENLDNSDDTTDYHKLKNIHRLKRLAPIYKELEKQLPYKETIANIKPLIKNYYKYKRVNISTEAFIRKKTIYRLSTYSNNLPLKAITNKVIE